MSATRKFKPSHGPDKHKSTHRTSTEKEAQGNGGMFTVPAGQGPGLANKSPCVECPLRRDSVPGYLGGYTPEMYIEAMRSPASLSCHRSAGFDLGDLTRQRHCTGVAAFRANTGIIASVIREAEPVPGFRIPVVVPSYAHESTKLVGSDTEHYFATAEEFIAHHKPGQQRENKS